MNRKHNFRKPLLWLVAVASFAMSASASPSVSEPDDAGSAVDFDQIMDAVLVEMLRPGPMREGWSKGAADPHSAVAAAPGGAKQNYILAVDKDGDRSVTIVAVEDVAAAIPQSWNVLHRIGDRQPSDGSMYLTIAHLDGPLFFAGWDTVRRVGDAFCSAGGIGAELYETSGSAPARELPEGMAHALFAALVKRLQNRTVCWRYDRQADGYRVSYFLEDGRSLPAIDQFEERLTIVPAQPIEQLLMRNSERE